MPLICFWHTQKSGCNYGLVTILQLLTGEGAQDSVGSQEQCGESFTSQLLVNMTGLLQSLVENQVGNGSISPNVAREGVRCVESDS